MIFSTEQLIAIIMYTVIIVSYLFHLKNKMLIMKTELELQQKFINSNITKLVEDIDCLNRKFDIISEKIERIQINIASLPKRSND
jgi:peptidoglycan hydrolase CwlO-like protein